MALHKLKLLNGIDMCIRPKEMWKCVCKFKTPMMPTKKNDYTYKAYINMDFIISMWKHLKCLYMLCVYLYVNCLDGYMLIIILMCPSRLTKMLGRFTCHLEAIMCWRFRTYVCFISPSGLALMFILVLYSLCSYELFGVMKGCFTLIYSLALQCSLVWWRSPVYPNRFY